MSRRYLIKQLRKEREEAEEKALIQANCSLRRLTPGHRYSCRGALAILIDSAPSTVMLPILSLSLVGNMS